MRPGRKTRLRRTTPPVRPGRAALPRAQAPLVTPAERRDLERSARRERILRAAERVLAAQGAAGITARAIAREASVSVGTLYLYFPALEEIFLSLVVEGLDALAQALDRASRRDGGDPAPLFRRWAEAYRAYYGRYGHAVNVAAFLHPGVEEKIRPEIREELLSRFQRCYEIASRALSGGKAAEWMAAVPPERRAALFWAVAHGISEVTLGARARGIPFDFDTLVEDLVRLLARGAA